MAAERRSPPPVPFVFVAGHPCLDFVNTELILHGIRTDLLQDAEDLVRWLVESGALSAAQGREALEWRRKSGASRVVERAHSLRAALRDMLERIIAKKPIPDGALAAVNDVLERSPRVERLVRTDGSIQRRVSRAVQRPEDLLASVAESTADLLCEGDLRLIKKCGNPVCILFFYDSTKNRRRRWCSMDVCGNRMKVAAHYRRHRDER
jgi:predicted RNA-binding Zn ribbon-like protein